MKQNIDDVIRIIAEQEGISEQEALDEIRKAIDEGYDNESPSVRAYWASMPFKTKPTPQELIAFLAAQALNKNAH